MRKIIIIYGCCGLSFHIPNIRYSDSIRYCKACNMSECFTLRYNNKYVIYQ